MEKSNNVDGQCFPKVKGYVYCFVCTLFDISMSAPISHAFVSGFNNWKKGNEKVCEHKNGNVHRLAMMTWLSRVKKNASVNKQICN